MHELNQVMKSVPIPERMRGRPIDHRGFVVPWFVNVMDEHGNYDFRIVRPERTALAIRRKLCWICGQQLGANKAFAIGPMCVVNRVTAEAPGHLECVRWSVQVCPFMAKPKMRRNTAGVEHLKHQGPGISLDRNPGVTCIWVTKEYRVERDGDKGTLFRLSGEPVLTEFWSEGRAATHAEVMHAVETGLPFLREIAAKDKDKEGSLQAIDAMVKKAATIFDRAAA